MKHNISVFLSVILVLSMVFGCMPIALAEDGPDVSAQLELIYSHLDSMLQTDDYMKTWYYSVMDFDHNGRLEFYAACQHPVDRSTNFLVWEVSEDGTVLAPCTVLLDQDESFPDIITNAADAFYDIATGTWSYLFYDDIVLLPVDVYTVLCSVSLKNGEIAYRSYASEYSRLSNSYRYVAYMDSNGYPITESQFYSSALNVFADQERHAANFDWFRADEVTSVVRLSDSYEVFCGEKAAPDSSPITPPAILYHDELMPLAGTPGSPSAIYMTITRNPSSVKAKAGQTVQFVSDANVYDSAYWTFITDDGREVDLAFFNAHFVDSPVDGAYDPVLTIYNIDGYMNGWGFYCTYSFQGETAVTSTAWISVS